VIHTIYKQNQSTWELVKQQWRRWFKKCFLVKLYQKSTRIYKKKHMSAFSYETLGMVTIESIALQSQC
jgi:hypothetical protein